MVNSISLLWSKFLNLNSFGSIEVFSRLLNWLALPVVSLWLLPNVYGEVIIMNTLLIFTSSLGLLGQNRVVLVFGSKQHAVVISSFISSLIFSLSISLLAVLYFDISYLFLAVVASLNILNLMIAYYRVNEDLVSFRRGRLVYVLVRLLSVILLLLLNDDVYFYLLAEVLAVVLTIFTLLYRKDLFKISYRSLKTENFKTCFNFGMPLLIQTLFASIIQHSDKIIISTELGNEALANYYYIAIFCTSVSFVFAYYAQKHEVSIYNASSTLSAIKESKKFLFSSLKGSLLFFSISLPLYLISCIVNENYEPNVLYMVTLFLYFSSGVFAVAFSYYFTYLNFNRIILLSSIINAAVYCFFIFISIEQIKLWSIPFSGLLANLLTLIFYNYNLKKVKNK